MWPKSIEAAKTVHPLLSELCFHRKTSEQEKYYYNILQTAKFYSEFLKYRC